MPAQIKLDNIFFASQRFWLCNIAGWLLIDIAQSVIDAFDGAPLLFNIFHHLPGALVGMFVSWCVHLAYAKLQWHKQHPICLFPAACLIAAAFATVDTLINRFDSGRTLLAICAPEYPKGPDFYCGKLTSYFTHSVFAMLVWVIIYLLIQAERKNTQEYTLRWGDSVYAAFALTATVHISNILNTMGWASDSSYLFSNLFYLHEVIDSAIVIIFSSYVLLINPRAPIFGSRLLPWLPTLGVMTFCFAIVSIGFGAALWRLFYLQLGTVNSTAVELIYYLLLGDKYGHWVSKGHFAGQLQGSFTHVFLMSLFFVGVTFSKNWQPKLTHFAARFEPKESLAFWSLNLGFWLFFAVLVYTSDVMGLRELGKSVPLISTLAFSLVGIFVGAVLRSQIQSLTTVKPAAIIYGAKIFFTCILLGFSLTSTLWLVCYAYIFIVLDGYKIENYVSFVSERDYILACISVACTTCGLWSMICQMIESQRVQRDSNLRQLQLEINIREVQLNTLAGKVDPHFIFNALNNIRALIDEDSEKARAALVVLSDILRSPILNSSQNRIPIAEEMRLVRNYIALSKIQFEDLLVYTEDVSDEVFTALIPAMMLQIAIENSIKHGISQLPDGGILSLHIYKKESQLVCTLINSGRLQSTTTTAGFGVGVKTIQQRLELLYHNNASFNLREENDTVVAQLILPFETIATNESGV